MHGISLKFIRLLRVVDEIQASMVSKNKIPVYPLGTILIIGMTDEESDT